MVAVLGLPAVGSSGKPGDKSSSSALLGTAWFESFAKTGGGLALIQILGAERSAADSSQHASLLAMMLSVCASEDTSAEDAAGAAHDHEAIDKDRISPAAHAGVCMNGAALFATAAISCRLMCMLLDAGIDPWTAFGVSGAKA